MKKTEECDELHGGLAFLMNHHIDLLFGPHLVTFISFVQRLYLDLTFDLCLRLQEVQLSSDVSEPP